MPNLCVIHDGNYKQYVDPVVDGEKKARGLIPRNYKTHPVGYLKGVPPMHAVDIPLIPQSEWSDRIKEKIATKSQLSDVRNTGNNGGRIPALDQGQVGYCWAHSSTGAVQILRALENEPYVPLSAYAVAATIKKGADEGGWGAQSLDFIMDKGVPAQSIWPQGDRNYTKYDNQTTWDNAALHKVSEGWVDLQAAQYDRKLSFQQEATLLLSNVPVVKDENWWSHSILGLDLVEGASLFQVLRGDSGKLMTLQELEAAFGVNGDTGGFGVRILNSWGDSWEDNGTGILAGSKAVSDGAVAPRVTYASAA